VCKSIGQGVSLQRGAETRDRLLATLTVSLIMSKAEGYLRPFRGRDGDFDTFWAKFLVLSGIKEWDDDTKKTAHLPLFLE